MAGLPEDVLRPSERVVLVGHDSNETEQAAHLIAKAWNTEAITPAAVLSAAVADAQIRYKAEQKETRRLEREERQRRREERQRRREEAGEDEESGSDAEGDEEEEDEDEEGDEGSEKDMADLEDEEEPQDDGFAIAIPARPRQPASDMAMQAFRLLREGDAVPASILHTLMLERLRTPRVRFRGYVLGGLDLTCDVTRAFLEGLAETDSTPSLLFCVESTNTEAKAREQMETYDPSTGMRFASTSDAWKQAVKPWILRDFEEQLLQAEEATASDEDDDEEDDEGNEEDEAQAEATIPTNVEVDPVPPPEPETLLESVRTPRAFSASAAAKHQDAVVSGTCSVTSYAQDLQLSWRLEGRRLLRLRPHQPIDDLVNEILMMMEAVFFARPVIDPISLGSEDTDFSSDAEIFEYFGSQAAKQAVIKVSGEDEDEIEPPALNWRPGPFGPYCPVSMKAGKLIHGQASFAAGYRGFIFLMADEDSLEAFLECPIDYLKTTPKLPLRMWIVSSPANPGLEKAILALKQRFGRDPQVTVIDAASFRNGDSTTEEQIQALAVAAKDEEAWIVYNAPTSSEEVELMHLHGPHPMLTLAIPPPNNPAPPAIVTADDDEPSQEETIKSSAEMLSQAKNPALEEFNDLCATIMAKGYEVISLPDAMMSLSEEHLQKIESCMDMLLRVPAKHAEHTFATEEEDQDTNPQFGLTGQFCPVTLQEHGSLAPALPDVSAIVEGQFYHFLNEDARDEFVAFPSKFLSAVTPPAPRFSFLGPAGAGKTSLGRKIAQRHGMFHMDFMEKLREVAYDKHHPLHETISEHLEGDAFASALATEICLDLVRPLWKEEPYKSAGFILEHFPRNADDVRAMTAEGLFFDCTVQFELNVDIAQRRLLEQRLRKYKLHRKKVLELRVEATAKREHQKQEKREKFKKEQEQKREAFEAEERKKAEEDPKYTPQLDAFVEDEYISEDEEDVEDNEDNEELLTDDEARAKFLDELQEQHEVVADAAVGAVDCCRDEFRIPVHVINASIRATAAMSVLTRTLEKYLECRTSILETVWPIDVPEAELLLASGTAHMSKFSYWCPVQVHTGNAVQPLFHQRYPVLYKNLVVYFSSDAARQAFSKHPLKYWAAEAPTMFVPLRCIITGNPMSGKTTIADCIADTLGTVHLTPSAAISSVLISRPHHELSHQVRQALRQGQAVNAMTAAMCVRETLLAAKCQAFGFVLRMEELTTDMLEAMRKEGIEAQVVVDLAVGIDTALARAEKARNPAEDVPSHDGPQRINSMRAATTSNEAALAAHCQSRYRNWYHVESKASKWAIRQHVLSHLSTLLWQATMHAFRVQQGKPAAVDGLGLDIGTIHAHQGSCRAFCPVSLVEESRLIQADDTDTKHTVEFRGLYYRLASQDALAKFCADPEKYVSAELPEHLPSPCSKMEAQAVIPFKVAFGGFCPVYYVDNGRRYESLVQGSSDHAVKYRGAVYVLHSPLEVSRFMEQPHIYADVPLPAKLPAKVDPMNVSQLPLLGYLEQTTASVLTKAVTAVGLQRPKYPGLSGVASAVKHAALYLKAHNPRNDEYKRTKFRAQLKEFEAMCNLVKEVCDTTPKQPTEDVIVQSKLRKVLEAQQAENQPSNITIFSSL